jgi:hypothetical protein
MLHQLFSVLPAANQNVVSFRIAAFRKCTRLETRRPQGRPCRIECVFQNLQDMAFVEVGG